MSDGSAPGTLRPCTSRLMRRTCRTESGRIALQLSSFASSRLSERLAVRPLLAVAAGLLHAYSLASPVDGSTTWWAQILSLTVLAGLIPSGTGARRAAGFAALFGMSWMAGTFWWLFISLHVYGGLAQPLAVAAVVLLAVFLSLYYALAAALFAAAADGRPARDAALFAGFWLGAELLRGTLLTGFPWGASGYAHADGPLSCLAPWVGVYGMSAVSAWIASLLARAVVAWRQIAYRASLVLTVAVQAASCLTGGSATGAQGASLRVALLQGNIPQDQKFDGRTGVPLALEFYQRALRDSPAELVLAPETALPLLPQQLPGGYLKTLTASFAASGRAALIGLPLGSVSTGYTNSVVGLAAGSVQYRYDKHHLVPFGEFVPPMFRWFTEMMDIPLGNFERGTLRQPSFTWKEHRIAPNICYEDLFGEELAVRFRDPAQAPTLLANFSNIAWFGDTTAVSQHLHISRLRAMEFGRPVIRATNTGATAVIDHRGKVTHLLPGHTRGVLVGDVTPTSGMTPYARWVSTSGIWPLWLVPAAALWCLARRRLAHIVSTDRSRGPAASRRWPWRWAMSRRTMSALSAAGRPLSLQQFPFAGFSVPDVGTRQWKDRANDGAPTGRSSEFGV